MINYVSNTSHIIFILVRNWPQNLFSGVGIKGITFENLKKKKLLLLFKLFDFIKSLRLFRNNFTQSSQKLSN